MVIAPDVTRPEPPTVASEREMLEGWLDYHRATLLHKCAGLSTEQLKRRPCPPSGLSLLGLVRHLTEVERWWFRAHVGGEQLDDLYCSAEDPDGDFNDLDGADVEAVFATFHAEVAAGRKAVAGRSLEDTVPQLTDGLPLSVRWVYVHMIEEYARHNGHADLLREQLDGVTGV